MKKRISILLLVLVIISFNSCFIFSETSSMEEEQVEVKRQNKTNIEKIEKEVAKPIDPIVGLWQSIHEKSVTVEFTTDGMLIFRKHGDVYRITTYGYQNKLLHVNIESSEIHPFEFPNGEHKKLYISNNFIKGEITSRFIRLK